MILIALTNTDAIPCEEFAVRLYAEMLKKSKLENPTQLGQGIMGNHCLEKTILFVLVNNCEGVECRSNEECDEYTGTCGKDERNIDA